MQRSKIEWCDFSVNPVKGLCPVQCPYCYARAMYHRFGWDGTIRYDESAWKGLEKIPAKSRVFVGSTIDLFHPEVMDVWATKMLWSHINSRPDVTFIFLTKCPQNLPKEWPDNCWAGMSVTKGGIGVASTGAITCFEDIEAKVKFVSFEPLLERVDFTYYTEFVDWVIIGQQTPSKPATTPKLEWITEIEVACQDAGIPYFEKDNLRTLLNRQLVQDFPTGVALGR